ncbi:MAG TPA: HEAT repeat domain-containing protein, partial [Longimicrobiales bacterium]|nr:HEAT repeat domain-containing protein [Longimicrobiales bacterium]
MAERVHHRVRRARNDARWRRRMSLALGGIAVAGIAACVARSQPEPELQQPAWVGYQLPPGSPTAPVLYPEEALTTFRLPEGFRIELVAAEPLVQDPVRADFDPDGRLWVVEMTGYMTDFYDAGAAEPTGRIAVLEDLNGDGVMDRRTVFLDSLVLPRTIAILERGVLVAAPPYLWLARDTTGDLRADVRELVRDDYGDPAGNVEHNANGLLWGIDNWLHNANYAGQIRARPDGFEFRRTPSQGQWGISMDEYGRLYRNSNEDPLRTDLVPSHYALRNPAQQSLRGVHERLTPNLPVWPIHKTPAINRGYRPQTMRPDSTLAHYTAAGAPTAYTGSAFPAEYRQQVFIAEPVGNLVGRVVVEDGPNGIPRAVRVDPEGTDFLASTDERFRPVNLTNGPDGALYVIDMYRGIIQHRFYITGFLEQQIMSRGLEQPTGLGRIYRIVHESSPRPEPVRLSGLRPAELVELLAHPNGWHRITAQRLLVERGDRSVAPALRDMLARSADDRARLHALWTLEGLGEANLDAIRTALADASPHVRAAAVRIAEPWLSEPGHPVVAAVTALRDDESFMVRRQLALSAGVLPPAQRETVLAEIVERHGTDPLMPDLVISGLAGLEAQFLERLLERQEPQLEAQLAPTIQSLAALLIRTRNLAAVQSIMAAATDESRPRWQRLALFAGARSATGTIQLEAEPAALTALAASEDQALSSGAEALLARLNWPGKPTPPRVVRALTAEEQAYYDAGEQQYAANCAGCHQPDGRGLEGVAKPLVG